MKLTNTALTLLTSLLLFPAGFAQDATLERQKQEQDQLKDRETRLQQEERAKAALEKKPVIYSGFFVDAARAEKGWKKFSLRTPRDPKTDYRNVALEERTERPRGFVLFRIGF